MEFPPESTHPDRISDGYVTFIGLTVGITFISITCVVLRFISRKLTSKFWWDDWLILAALVLALGFVITTVLVATVAGAGYQFTEYSLSQLEKYFQIALANNVIYNASITLSKASILVFYKRVFSVGSSFLLCLRIVAFLLVGYFLAAAGGLIFASSPVEAQWKIWIPATTINAKAFWLSMAIINICLDLILLAIPQARVWKLQLSMKKKVLLSLVFMLGTFVVIASIVRITYLLTINVTNPTYTMTDPGIWTMIEMNTSIICACLPMLPSLFRLGKIREVKQPSKYGQGTHHSQSHFTSRSRQYGYADLESSTSELHGYHTSIETSRRRSDGPEVDQGLRVQKDFTIS